MAELQLQYVINATMDKLNGLTQLTQQLHELKRLALEGADFGVRIDPRGLNGIRDAVAKAVAEGVHGGGTTKVTGTGPGLGAASVDMGNVVTELRNVVTALNALAGKGSNVPTGGARRPQVDGGALEDAVQRAESASRVSANPTVMRNLVARIKGLTGDLEKKDPEKMIDEILSRLDATQRMSGRQFKRTYSPRISEVRSRLTMTGRGDEGFDAAVKDLLDIYGEIRTHLIDKEQRITQRIRNAADHARVGADNVNWRGERSEFNAQGARPAAGGSGSSLAFNQASVDAAFVRAADAFGQRLLAYLPGLTHGGGGGGFVPPATAASVGGGFIASSVAQYGSTGGNASNGRQVCPRCRGTGKVSSGMYNGDCFQCGGTGDIAHPNLERIKQMGAMGPRGAGGGPSGGGPVLGGTGMPNLSTSGYQYNEFLGDLAVPMSVGYKQQLLGRIERLSKRRAKGGQFSPLHGKEIPFDDTETQQMDLMLSHYQDMYNANAVPLSRVRTSPRIINGVFGTIGELNTHVANPAVGPLRAPTGPYLDNNNPIKQATQNTIELTRAMNELSKIDTKKLEDTFTHIADAMKGLSATLGSVRATVGDMDKRGMTLQYTKLLNQEKERHEEWKKNNRVERQAEQEKAAIMERAKSVQSALRTSVSAQRLPEVALSGEKLQQTIERRFRQMERLSRRNSDLEFERAATVSVGGNLNDVSTSMGQNAIKYTGTRTALLQDLARAAKIAPRAYGFLESEHGISGVAGGASRVADAQIALSQFESSTELSKLLFSGKQKPLTKDEEAKRLKADKEAAEAAVKLKALGFGDGTAGQLSATLRGEVSAASSATTSPSLQALREFEESRKEAQRLNGLKKRAPVGSTAYDADIEAQRLRMQNAATLLASMKLGDGTLTQKPNELRHAVLNTPEVGAEAKRLSEAAAVVAQYEEARRTSSKYAARGLTPQQSSAQVASQEAATKLKALGFGDGTVGQKPDFLRGQVLGASQAIEPHISKLIELAGKHSEARQATVEHMKAWDLLGRKLRDVAVYATAAGAVYGAVSLLKKGLSEAVMFEADMAQVQGIFVSKSPYQRAQVQSGVMDAAYQYGIQRQQAAGVAKLFAQTGASPEKTLDLTSATLMAQRGAGLNPDQASEMLIAVDNITGGRVKSGDIIDRISRVEARHAVTAQDMSTILQKVGPLAEHMQPGMLGSADGLDMLMGMGTSMIERTRMSGAQAGTTLKFLLARLSAPQVQRKLQDQFGINLAEGNSGQMRNMTDIFGDLAAKYKDYSASGQTGKAAALLTTFAGARQAAAAAAMFEDWKSSMDVALESSLAFGDAQRRLAIQMDTMDSKLGQMNAAFGNFATSVVEKTGLLAGLKGLTSATGSVLNFGADHPFASVATVGGAALGMGVLAKSGWMGSLLTEMAVLKRLVPWLGGAVGLGGAVSAGYGLGSAAQRVYYRNEYAAADRADYLAPSEFDRKNYDESDQGKQFAANAKRFGMSTGMFAQILTGAVAESNAAADTKFGAEGGSEAGHKKVSRFLEKDFVERLKDALPGFKDLGDEATLTAEAMQSLRGAVQYGGVSYAAQQSEFTEKAATLIQQFQEAFNNQGPSELLKGHIQTQINAGYGNQYSLRLPGQASQGMHDITTSAQELGLGMNAQIAARLHAGTDRRGLYAEILNSLSPDLKVGAAMSRFRPGGVGLFDQVDALVMGDKTKTTTYGQALDKVFSQVKKLSSAQAEQLELKKKTNKLTAEENELLRQNANYQALVTSLISAPSGALGVSGRKTAAAAGSASFLSDQLGGGGIAIATITAALQEASTKTAGNLDDDSPAAKAAREFQRRQADPRHRESMRLDVISAVTGTNLRAYLKDKVMEEFLRYGARQGEMALSREYVPGTGETFDTTREQASNDSQALHGFLKMSAALPMDKIRASHRLNMAIAAGSTMPAGIGNDVGPDVLTDVGNGRNLIDPNALIAKEINKIGNKVPNTQQIVQLTMAVLEIKRGLSDWVAGEPDSILDSLSDADKKQIIEFMGVDPKDAQAVQRWGPTMQRFWLSYLAAKAKKSNRALYKNQSAVLRQQAGSALSMTRANAKYALDDMASLRAIGITNPMVNSAGFLMRSGMVGAQQAASTGRANLQYQNTMEGIRLRASQVAGGMDENGKLIGADFMTEAAAAKDVLTQGVLEANQSAQQAMLQLLNDAELDYLHRVEDHSKTMVSMVSGPLTDLLSSPDKIFSSQKFGQLATQIGSAMNRKLAESFTDNLFGHDGAFGQALEGLFGKSELFKGADLIKAAHIQGITEGMREAYGTAATGGIVPEGASYRANGMAALPVGTVLGAGASFDISKMRNSTKLSSGMIWGDVVDPTKKKGRSREETLDALLSAGKKHGISSPTDLILAMATGRLDALPTSIPNDTVHDTDTTSVAEARRQLAKYGITKAQRAGAYTGKYSEAMFNYVNPGGYAGHVGELYDVFDKLTGGNPINRANNISAFAPREDAWRMYLGIKQANNTFDISDYAPANAKSKKTYLKMNGFGMAYPGVKSTFRDPAWLKQFVGGLQKKGGKGVYQDMQMGVMGNYTASLGKDKQGSYLSYYDIWDLDSSGAGLIGKPYEIYDRLYYNPDTFEVLSKDRSKRTYTKQNTSGNVLATLAGGAPMGEKPNVWQGFKASSRSERGYAFATTPYGYVPTRSLGSRMQLTPRAMDAAFVTVRPDSAVTRGAQAAAELNAAVSQKQAAKDAKKQQLKDAAKQAALMATMYASTAIGARAGVKGRGGEPLNYAGEGAQVGALIGSFLPIPGGTYIGAALGGLLGGRFGKSEPPPPVPQFDALGKIERNTREAVEAIKNQTNTLLSPENRLLFAPSSFALPGYRPFGAESGGSAATTKNGNVITINIPINGAQDPTAVAEQVNAALREQLGQYGTFSDVKY